MTVAEKLSSVDTFIYGSCVSRDTFKVMDSSRHRLIAYVARQSLISAFAPAAHLPTPPLESAFQRRMVNDDWASGLPKRLADATPGLELLLWDLCDERLGIYVFPDGSVLTRSVDLMRIPQWQNIVESATLLDFGTEAHLTRFTAAVHDFKTLLDDLGLRERLVLVAAPWAEFDEYGAPTPHSFGRSPQEAAAHFARYSALAAAIIECRTVGAEETVASAHHRWGRAPFHYTSEVYHGIADEITEVENTWQHRHGPK